MTHDRLRDQLGDSLRRRAQAVASRRDLSAAALDQAHRMRARRRTSAVVAGLALIAATVPVTLNLTGGANDRAEVDYAAPAETGQPDPRQSEPRQSEPRQSEPRQSGPGKPEANQPTRAEQTPAELRARTPNPERAEPSPGDEPAEPPTGDTEIDFAALPTGPAPANPYYDDAANQLIDGDTRIAVDLAGLSGLDRVSGGYVAHTGGERSELFLIEPDGSMRPLSESTNIESYATSVDGDRIAWVEGQSGAPNQVLKLADGHGTTIGELPGGAMEVTGFLRDRVAVSRGYGETPIVWDAERGTTTPVAGAIDSGTTDGHGYLSVVNGEDKEFRTCSTLLDTSKGNRELWSGCERYVRELAPGGEFAVTVDPRSDGLGDLRFDVVDAATGEEILAVGGTDAADATYHDFTFESDGAVLIDTSDDGQRAIVRCTLDGDCELATQPRAYDLNAAGPAPYILEK